MNDKYINFVSQNIYSIQERKSLPTRLNTTGQYIKIDLSSDKFTVFCDNTLKYTFSKPLEITIYDEGILNGREDRNLRERLIKKLNKLNIQKINFILSDSTLPVYNRMMNNLNWKHEIVTTITMKIDRTSTNKNAQKWRLNETLGKIELPEEKLIWLPSEEIKKLEGKTDNKVIEDTLKLKEIISFTESYLKENYQTKYLTDYEKILLIYRLINMCVRIPWNYINIINDKAVLKQNYPRRLLEPCSTWKNREGLSEGRARLLAILLNNPIINIDATTIHGTYENNRTCWVGVVLDNKLYDCCTITPGVFRNLQDFGYEIKEPNKQIYPSIYEYAHLSDTEIKRIENHVKKLKR